MKKLPIESVGEVWILRRRAGVAACRTVLLGFFLAYIWGFRPNEVQAQQVSTRPDAAQELKGFKLVVPTAKFGSKEFQAQLVTEINVKTSDLAKSLRPLPEEYRANLIDRLPIGFGTLRKTRNLPVGNPARWDDPRITPLAQQVALERIFDDRDFYPAQFLEVGAITQRAVGRVAIRFTNMPDAGWGTGFMVAPSIMMTNNHVIPDGPAAARLELQMNYSMSFDGNVGPVQTFEFDPESFYYTNVPLDFTLIRVKAATVVTPTNNTVKNLVPGDSFGVIQIGRQFLYSEGQPVNIVQHPDGRPKEVVLRNNQVEKILDTAIRYKADTEPGSSGSPVFNNSWVLVALHHSSGDQDPTTMKWLNNEGIRIDRIVENVRSNVSAAVLKELGL